MRRHLTGTTRWGFVACVAVSNLLAGLVSVFVWMPLADRILPAEHTMAPWIPMLLSTLLALPIASFVSRRSAKTIQDMLEATKSISRGDYSVRVEEGGSGDVAELLRSFNRMTAEFGSTEMMRNDFINTFSHEFKTPIVSIRGFARRLRKGGLTETQQNEYLDFIAEESERLSHLASNVLLISRYETQKLVGEQTDYDLDEQIRTSVLRLESQWSPRHLIFELDLPRLPYRNNSEMMEHVWMNLIGNAIKFSPDGGVIFIAGKMEDSCITISIRDEGPGIRPEELGHIFDKFYQGDSSRAAAGNGLGLALVHRIVELCGGKIRVESTVGEGSTFYLTLPADGQTSKNSGQGS